MIRVLEPNSKNLPRAEIRKGLRGRLGSMGLQSLTVRGANLSRARQRHADKSSNEDVQRSEGLGWRRFALRIDKLG